MMKISKHARKRCQQRGITPDVLELLIMFGFEIDKDSEACKMMISKREKKQLLNRLSKVRQVIEKEVYAVVSHEDNVITVAHKFH